MLWGSSGREGRRREREGKGEGGREERREKGRDKKREGGRGGEMERFYKCKTSTGMNVQHRALT